MRCDRLLIPKVDDSPSPVGTASPTSFRGVLANPARRAQRGVQDEAKTPRKRVVGTCFLHALSTFECRPLSITMQNLSASISSAFVRSFKRRFNL